MTTPLPKPHLHLLGPASLRLFPGSPGVPFAVTERRLDRRTAGMLAYLTLEGQTSRSVLAGLLWPEVAGRTARTNLRQSLHRLHQLAPGMVDGDDMLRLNGELHVDVARLELAVFSGQEAQVLDYPGELLDGHEYDDCPDFMDWLAARRERLHTRRVQAHARLSEAAEARGDLDAALRHAGQGLNLDPVSEVAHRQMIRLYLQLGDRGAALRASERCAATLAREFGVLPSSETLELVRSVQHEAAAPAPPPAFPVPRITPGQVPLVGRQAEWSRLASGWAAGQFLLVSGPPGVGKSRLLRDFLAAQGPLHCFQGRPGDEAVPYLSLSRAFRALLPLVPDPALSGWVRSELSRLLPELGPDLDGKARRPRGGAPPLGTQPLRFLEAAQHFLALALGTGDGSKAHLLLLDDFQFCDESSRQVWSHALDHPALLALGLRGGMTFRPDELPPARLEALTQMVRGDAAVLVDLEPLSVGGVGALLGEMLTPVPPGLAAALARHTGGNPLFLLETLRSLDESGALDQASFWPLPLPSRVGPLIVRRLERLSPEAGRVAQVAAVAGTDLTLELAAAVLETRPLELSRPWAELEAAQIMRGLDFAHDLMAGAARSSIPAPIRALLHGRIGAVLEASAVSESSAVSELSSGSALSRSHPEAARVAWHWQEAGEPKRAAPWWIQAGWAALNRGAWTDAAAAFTRALQPAQPAQPVQQDALYGLGRALLGSRPQEAEKHLLGALSARPTPRRETDLRATLSELYRVCGRLQEGGEQIRQAIALARDDASGEERSRLWRTSFWIELRSGRLEQAEHAINQARTLAPHEHGVADEHALLLWHSGRFQDAAQMYEALARRRQEQGEPEEESRAAFGSNRAWTYWALGRNAEADALLGRPYQPTGLPFAEALRQANHSTVLTSLGRSADALHELACAEEVMRAYPIHLVDLLHRRSVVYHRAERHAEALPPLLEALPLARQVGDPYRLSYTLASLGAAQAHLGDLAAARSACAEALDIAGQIGFPLTLAIAHQGAAVVARLDGRRPDATQHAVKAAGVARACGMVEQLGQALLLQGLSSDERGPLKEALDIGQRHALPDLVWRAASALHEHEDGHLGVARQARDELRALAAPGWF